jgi:hypothetical protein
MGAMPECLGAKFKVGAGRRTNMYQIGLLFIEHCLGIGINIGDVIFGAKIPDFFRHDVNRSDNFDSFCFVTQGLDVAFGDSAGSYDSGAERCHDVFLLVCL